MSLHSAHINIHVFLKVAEAKENEVANNRNQVTRTTLFPRRSRLLLLLLSPPLLLFPSSVKYYFLTRIIPLLLLYLLPSRFLLNLLYIPPFLYFLSSF